MHLPNINHPISVTTYLYLTNKIAIPTILHTMMSPPTLSTHKLSIWTADFLFKLLTLKLVTIGCTETSVRIYHYSLRNNPEERSSQEITT